MRGASLGEIQPRLACPSCRAHAAIIQVIQGGYSDNQGPQHESVDLRAALIRRVLAEAGIDAGDLGYDRPR